MTPHSPPLLLLGCGILQQEIHFLIEKNGWPLDTYFIDSALHINFDKLSQALTSALKHNDGREVIVFYGACHPLMEEMLSSATTFRTEGQNCVEMLLGNERFTHELEQGAFFLLEEWAQHWEQIVTATFGTNLKVIRELYQSDRRYLLAVSTPCSGDFRVAAEEAGRLVGLPLKQLEVSLDNLEAVLKKAIRRKMRETS
ncbi:DUF1638 domain-containing protein [Geobacter pelophilus]|uniref:DUF1638 domain-containing protein n=1 Tax=Geoanaerobacter pelophilus TaxID=60036 RepID=A0AAW4L4V7_9BACT|nr:DUF1638 domain-containing protein [Geoanaerobacter pelophilus]MBT0665923.1 DUF1638 domain-containing protein [Geoanaerobacter pelophilus]